MRVELRFGPFERSGGRLTRFWNTRVLLSFPDIQTLREENLYLDVMDGLVVLPVRRAQGKAILHRGRAD